MITITFVIESEKAFKLFLVLRTWHLVVRPEGRFHFRCQKGGKKKIIKHNQFFQFLMPKSWYKIGITDVKP